MPTLSPEDHRDGTGGSRADSFLARCCDGLFGMDLALELVGCFLRVLGWVCWQGIRLVCILLSETLSAWPF